MTREYWMIKVCFLLRKGPVLSEAEGGLGGCFSRFLVVLKTHDILLKLLLSWTHC
jgi:hypothetical protein